MKHPLPWDYEVHELSEGYSAIVYDANGIAVADHLTEEQAAEMVKTAGRRALAEDGGRL